MLLYLLYNSSIIFLFSETDSEFSIIFLAFFTFSELYPLCKSSCRLICCGVISSLSYDMNISSPAIAPRNVCCEYAILPFPLMNVVLSPLLLFSLIMLRISSLCASGLITSIFILYICFVSTNPEAFAFSV